MMGPAWGSTSSIDGSRKRVSWIRLGCVWRSLNVFPDNPSVSETGRTTRFNLAKTDSESFCTFQSVRGRSLFTFERGSRSHLGKAHCLDIWFCLSKSRPSHHPLHSGSDQIVIKTKLAGFETEWLDFERAAAAVGGGYVQEGSITARGCG